MLEYILLIAGIALLLKSADYIIEGSSTLAKKLGVSTLVIGLTIVSLGTSLPELIVNVFAALKNSADIAFGNIIGSNMINTLLCLGILALIANLKVKGSTVWKEIPFSILATVVVLVFAAGSFLNSQTKNLLLRTDGIILLLFLCIFIYYVFTIAKSDKELLKETKNDIKEHSYLVVSLMIGGGVIGLFLGGKWVVDSAVIIARSFGLSEFLISATIIAIGTSLPEILTAIVAAMKNNIDLAVGNVVGSNILNIFLVLGVTSVITPLQFPNGIIVDILLLLFITFLLFVFMFIGKRHQLTKWEGVLFIVLYLMYMVFIIIRG